MEDQNFKAAPTLINGILNKLELLKNDQIARMKKNPTLTQRTVDTKANCLVRTGQHCEKGRSITPLKHFPVQYSCYVCSTGFMQTKIYWGEILFSWLILGFYGKKWQHFL